MFADVRDEGIVLLDEGTHQFTLQNGASLMVYASPHTPALGQWGFQYRPDHGHEFDIEKGTDIVVTHEPPKGILDYTYEKERAGCADLFAAVARARPKVHSFGHIHEGWGARVVSWKDEYGGLPTHFTAIDNGRSKLVEDLASLRPSRFDTGEDAERKLRNVRKYEEERCCVTSPCEADEYPIEYGE